MVVDGASDAPLVCTGVACRKKTIFGIKVYALAHWIDAAGAAEKLESWKGRNARQLAKDQRFYDALTSADVEKRLRLVLMREVTAEQIAGGFSATLPKSRQRVSSCSRCSGRT